jgi:UDP-N-acetylmuramate dehydrogenase
LIVATTEDELVQILQTAGAEEVLLLAGGSNVVIADEGFQGLVVHLQLRGISVEGDGLVKVAAGEPWDDFVAMAVRNRWAGIECLSGIPGSAGATPIQNVGAYGQDVSETIVGVDVLERSTGHFATLTNEECAFAYRTSVFKNTKKDRFIVVSVTYHLRPNDVATVRYPELLRYIESHGMNIDNLQDVRDSVIAIRKRKGMVLDADDADTRSDGSFFMNPIVSPAAFSKMPEMPHFPAGEGVKLSAAWLIENAGFHKGLVHGNVGISSKHTLAIINRGGGTAREVLELARMIQQGVREKFGVELQPEPVVVGSGL